jgi:hypothetical protein
MNQFKQHAPERRRMLYLIKLRQHEIGWVLKQCANPPTFGSNFDQRKPRLGLIGPLVLTKGEAKKVTHKLDWRLFPKDEFTVKLTVSDPSITVPAELKLNFDRDDVSFTYEIQAGNKVGEFTVTLTPEVGDAVIVKVSVK